MFSSADDCVAFWKQITGNLGDFPFFVGLLCRRKTEIERIMRQDDSTDFHPTAAVSGTGLSVWRLCFVRLMNIQWARCVCSF